MKPTRVKILTPPKGFPDKMAQSQKGRALWSIANYPKASELIDDFLMGKVIKDIAKKHDLPVNALFEIKNWIGSLAGISSSSGMRRNVLLAHIQLKKQLGIMADLQDIDPKLKQPKLAIWEIAEKHGTNKGYVLRIAQFSGVELPETRKRNPIIDHFKPGQINQIWGQNEKLWKYITRLYYPRFKEGGVPFEDFQGILYELFIYNLRRYDPNRLGKDGKPLEPQKYAASYIRGNLSKMLQRNERGRIVNRKVADIENPLYGRSMGFPENLNGVQDTNLEWQSEAKSVFEGEHVEIQKHSKQYTQIIAAIRQNFARDRKNFNLFRASLSNTLWVILDGILKNPEMTGVELSSKLGVSRAAITAGVKKIVKKIDGFQK